MNPTPVSPPVSSGGKVGSTFSSLVLQLTKNEVPSEANKAVEPAFLRNFLLLFLFLSYM